MQLNQGIIKYYSNRHIGSYVISGKVEQIPKTDAETL